ncbi:MAG TPA: hypothetical protein VHB21_16320 [Minicystis sp.]|nr:hypothetical protein [Minicystis sp.]
MTRAASATSRTSPRRFALPGTLLLMFAALATPACLAGSDSVDGDGTDDGYDAIQAQTAIARAEDWVSVKLHYCQSANHQHDYDAACSATCNRQDNAEWNPYRSDCSGLVSWAWGLPAPGRVTTEFAPFQDDITHTIAASSLQPGDAVNNVDHIMLFKAWVHPGTEATFIEEPGCSSLTPYAHEFTSSVSVSGTSIHVAYNGMTFTAIRYDDIGSGGNPPPSGPPGCMVDGVAGQCISTSACASKGGHHATPGYCPGPDSEECCTPNAASPPPPPSCDVGGVSGQCISTSACAAKSGHHSTPGYCPGPDSEECCTPNASSPPPPPSGPSCTVEGVAGVCISTSACSGWAGHVSTPGFCPGPASEECCTKPPSCHVGSKTGMCIETSVCSHLGRHSTPGYCPGPANEECCTP